MKKKGQLNIVLLIIATIILAALVAFMMHEVAAMQGNGRVVNYAGIVRGATQRLVKNELYGKRDDSEIARLDEILLGLKTGEGTQNLNVLNDDAYQNKLNLLAAEWEKVKAAIYATRENPDKKAELYAISESYFILANDTVNAAEEYSDGVAKKINIVEFFIVGIIVFILATLFMRRMYDVQANKKLSKIAFVDPNTGLPNKRSCDERLNENVLIDAEQHLCCMMFDLNNLKTTNDTLGHEAGDALISSFASLLRRNAPAGMFIGRFGGDEFVGIQYDANKNVIEQFVNTLREQAICTTFDSAENKIHISFACGYAFSDDHNGCTAQSLMDIADKNMYLNKAQMKSKG